MKQEKKLIWFSIYHAVFAIALISCQTTAPTRRDNSAEILEIRSRAERGEARAQFVLGLLYTQGEGVPKDHKEAARWIRLAADQGHAAAQVGLGLRYKLGEGVPKDSVASANWYKKAALQGEPAAQCGLGLRYLEGDGVPRNLAESYAWLSISNENGDKSASKHLDAVSRQLSPLGLKQAKARAVALRSEIRRP